MKHWIEAMCEPRELILAWQPSDLNASRTRWAVGVVKPAGNEFVLHYLMAGDEFSRLNLGKTFDELRSLGYCGYPAFGLEKSTHQEGVKAALLRRLPPRRRSDFAEYAEQFGLRQGSEISDLALLAHTEAKLPSDGFSLIDPLNPDATRCDLLLEVAGYRHSEYADARAKVEVGMSAEIVAEPDSLFDPDAVMVRIGGAKVGNINRLQAHTFLHWLHTRRVEATVERLNGTPDKPRAFLFVQVSPVAAQQAA